MSTTLTETAKHTPDSVAVPASGDARTAASVNGAFQELANRSLLALGGVSGIMRGADEFAVEPLGTASSFTITVGGIQSLVLPREDGSRYEGFFYVSGSPSITQANVAGGTLANSTRYYVYAFNNAGTLAFEIVTTAPRASRVHQSGSGAGPVARRYLGTFVTDSSGAPIPCRAVRGVYTFRRSALAANALRVVNGSSTSWATADLSSLVPPHARLVRVELVAGSTGTLGSASLRTKGDTAGGIYVVNVLGVTGDTDRAVIDIETDSARALEYQVSHASVGCEVHVCGFSE